MAAPLMEQIRRNGKETKQERFARGPHSLAQEFVEFLVAEFLDFLKKGYWMLLPYEDVKDMVYVKYSPLGVVPQWEHRRRVIVDYSFYFVNQDTLKMGPEESMQFGKAVEQLLQAAVQAYPKFGPLMQYKLNISDGFYRIALYTSGVQRLGVMLPDFPGLPPLVASPLVLPMGWTDSPPFFCLFTETICDLANEELLEHPLEKIAGATDFEDCQTGTINKVDPIGKEPPDVTMTPLEDTKLDVAKTLPADTSQDITVTPTSDTTWDPHKTGKIPRSHRNNLRKHTWMYSWMIFVAKGTTRE
jgi:hypothetical protein